MIAPRRAGYQAAAAALFIAFLCIFSHLGSRPVRAQDAAPSRIFYEIILPSARAPELGVRATIVAPEGPGETTTVDLRLPEGVSPQNVAATPADVTPMSSGVVRIEAPAGSRVTVSYSLRLRSGLMNPAAQPGAPYASAHLGDFAYVAGRDTLPRPVRAQSEPDATIAVSPPPEWRAFASGIGELRPGQSASVENPQELVLLLGPLSVHRSEAPGGRVTVVTAGDMPWPAEDSAESVQAILGSLADAGFRDFITDVTIFQIRYPGALRLNPVIAGHTVGDATLVLWTGLGSLDWWRKHAARTLVRWLLERTVAVAPEAAWFSAGMPEYGTLLLLHDLGYVSADEMYHALRTLYATGIHYTGPGWPSLVLAGVSSPRSHASERVLEFRAPLVAFLLDVELREVSGGTASILDMWLKAAEEQRRSPHNLFHTASLLSSQAEFGDLSAFAEQYLFGSRIPPADFDGMYRRWLATYGEDGP